MPGIFANQNVVCRLRDAATLAFLADKFGPAASATRGPAALEGDVAGGRKVR